jgi:hypothetical protein
MNISEQVLILSAERKENHPQINERVTAVLKDMIEDLGINYTEALGCYKGESERSFVCILRNQEELETLKGFAFNNFNQESVLYKDSNGQCYLEYQDGQSEKIGKMVQTNPKAIETLDNYTIVNGYVFTVR